VTDQTGAVIPGASIVATEQSTESKYRATTDVRGEAIIHLDQGNYDLNVQARGFKTWENNEVKVNGEIQRSITLIVFPATCGPCVVVEGPEIPLVQTALLVEIPLIPMQQLVPPGRPLRHRRRWL
jgi:hypothetical protein